MKVQHNPHRDGRRLADDAPYPSDDAESVSALYVQCPKAAPTPLADVPDLAERAGVAAIWVKDERGRMGLGSFKALGAAYAIALQASQAPDGAGSNALAGWTYVAASAGNHGLSVAAGARIFGARAVIYIAETVPEVFAERLRLRGADVRREGADYAASMAAAHRAAKENGWTLLSDSSWPGYTELPYRVMEGYLQLAAELYRQAPEPPSHIVLQAGVGGLAASVAAYARRAWGLMPEIIVVEPESAAALQASIAAGRCVVAPGPDSIMGRLDCKEPSLIALNGLGRDADWFVTLSDDEVSVHLPALAGAGLDTTPSGAAGLALVLNPDARAALGIGRDATVLCILSEQPE